MEIKMEFIENVNIPKATQGRVSKDWLTTLTKIPIGKAWVTEAKGISTIRKAVVDLVKSGKVTLDEYTIVQRGKGGVAKGYVSHNAVKKSK